MQTEKWILLVEDNASYRGLILALFQRILPNTRLLIAKDGAEAVDILQAPGAFPSSSPPDLVLLDLNLPKKSGLEVLTIIKSDPRLRSIPVIILSSSTREQDVQQSYALSANCYLNKPQDLAGFEEMIRAIDRFWHKSSSERFLAFARWTREPESTF